MAEIKRGRNNDVLSLKNHEKLPELEFLFRVERMLICLLLISPFFFSCKTTTPTAVSQQPQIISHQVPNNHFPPMRATIFVRAEADSLSKLEIREGEIEFFRWVESSKRPVNIANELTKIIQYPMELCEEEIEGRWIYEVHFDGQSMTTWVLRKGVEGTVQMEREIEKALGKLKPDVKFFYAGKCSVFFLFEVKLEKGY